MTRTLTLMLVLALAAPVMAQEPVIAPSPEAAALASGEAPAAAPAETQLPAPAKDAVVTQPESPFAMHNVVIGVGGHDEENNSSKFMEYRSYPNGAVLPYLRFFGKDKLLYDISARNAFQTDAWYGLRLEKGWFALRGEVVRIPHGFGNGAVSVLQDLGNGEFRLPTGLQQQYQTAIENQRARNGAASVNFAFLNGLATDLVAGTERSQIGLQRDRGNLELRLTRNQPVDVRLAYNYEDRSGSRGSGTAFGFGNVVETPEPIDYRTHDVALSAEWAQKWGLVRGGVRLNKFDNRITSQTFDNPFRFTDSTDPSAYQSPGAASIGGPAVGRLALPPDNEAITGSLGFSTKFGGNSRLSADASYGQWTQNEQFIPYTTNTAITAPFRATDPSHLPAQSLDGRIDTTSLAATLSSRPVKGLNLTARYRRYDLDNKTPRLPFEDGYVRFDAVWEDIPRTNVPYGYTNDNLHLTAGYDFNLGDTTSLGLEAGFRDEHMDRTFRETEKTRQNTFLGSVHLRTADWLVLRGSVEAGHRDYDGLEIMNSEEASFLEAGAPANLLAVPAHSNDPAVQASYNSLGCVPGTACNLRYDQAPKDLWRASSMLQLMPGGNTSLSITYAYNKDDYTDTRYGLVNSKTWALTAEADYTPSERFNVFAFYGREDIRSFLRGRQSGATVSADARDDWTSDSKDLVDTIGGGVNLGVVKDKADLSLYGTYQMVDGNNDLAATQGGAAWLAKQPLGGVLGIENYDDTKYLTLSAELSYKLDKSWKLSLRGLYEDYNLDDAFSSGLQFYMPASFFLNGNDGTYRAGSVYLRLSYLW